MAFLYLAESADLTSPWKIGSGQPVIAKTTDTLKPSCFPECGTGNYPLHRYGMTCPLSGLSCYRKTSTLFSADFPVRTLALQELERAYKEADRDYSSKSLDSLANFDPHSFSWKTSQQSLFEGLTEFSWSSLRFGTIVDGRLYQPQKWAIRTCEKDGFYLPTPTASDYGKNVGRKSDGTPSERERY